MDTRNPGAGLAHPVSRLELKGVPDRSVIRLQLTPYRQTMLTANWAGFAVAFTNDDDRLMSVTFPANGDTTRAPLSVFAVVAPDTIIEIWGSSPKVEAVGRLKMVGGYDEDWHVAAVNPPRRWNEVAKKKKSAGSYAAEHLMVKVNGVPTPVSLVNLQTDMQKILRPSGRVA